MGANSGGHKHGSGVSCCVMCYQNWIEKSDQIKQFKAWYFLLSLNGCQHFKFSVYATFTANNSFIQNVLQTLLWVGFCNRLICTVLLYVGNLKLPILFNIQSRKNSVLPVLVFRLKPTSTEMCNYFNQESYILIATSWHKQLFDLCSSILARYRRKFLKRTLLNMFSLQAFTCSTYITCCTYLCQCSRVS